MTKKEQLTFDALRQELALERAMRLTPQVERDLPSPIGFQELSKGWDFNSYSQEVAKACSSSIHHAWGTWEKTSSQRPVSLYSTEMLAYRALRSAFALDCAKRIAKIDAKIAELEAST